MRKLIFILCIAFVGCSESELPEDEPKELVIRYYITMRAGCEGGEAIDRFETSQGTFNAAETYPHPNCNEWREILDIKNQVHEGYLMDVESISEYE